MSSPPRRLTCNDIPQVTIRSVPSAVVGWSVGPFPDVPKPVVPWSPSRSCALQSALHSGRQDIVSPLDMAIVSEFSFFDVTEESSFSAESTQYVLISDLVFPMDLTYLSQTPHLKCICLVLQNL